MTARERLLPKVDRIISGLEEPLSAEDLNGGWFDGSRSSWLTVFRTLRDHLRADEPLIPKYSVFFIGRGLDFAGVNDGPLCRLAEEIGADLRHAVREEARARGETYEKDDSNVCPNREKMKYIHRLLAGEEPKRAGEDTREDSDTP
jgi:hypothetical protein